MDTLLTEVGNIFGDEAAATPFDIAELQCSYISVSGVQSKQMLVAAVQLMPWWLPKGTIGIA